MRGQHSRQNVRGRASEANAGHGHRMRYSSAHDEAHPVASFVVAGKRFDAPLSPRLWWLRLG